MRDPIMTIVGLLVFGVVGFGVWYASMFVDNQFADVLRRESRKGWFWRNIEAVCVPIFSVVMVLGGIEQIAEVMGAPEWLLFCMALLMLCLMVPGVSSFLTSNSPIISTLNGNMPNDVACLSINAPLVKSLRIVIRAGKRVL